MSLSRAFLLCLSCCMFSVDSFIHSYVQCVVPALNVVAGGWMTGLTIKHCLLVCMCRAYSSHYTSWVGALLMGPIERERWWPGVLIDTAAGVLRPGSAVDSGWHRMWQSCEIQLDACSVCRALYRINVVVVKALKVTVSRQVNNTCES